MTEGKVVKVFQYQKKEHEENKVLNISHHSLDPAPVLQDGVSW